MLEPIASVADGAGRLETLRVVRDGSQAVVETAGLSAREVVRAGVVIVVFGGIAAAVLIAFRGREPTAAMVAGFVLAFLGCLIAGSMLWGRAQATVLVVDPAQNRVGSPQGHREVKGELARLEVVRFRVVSAAGTRQSVNAMVQIVAVVRDGEDEHRVPIVTRRVIAPWAGADAVRAVARELGVALVEGDGRDQARESWPE